MRILLLILILSINCKAQNLPINGLKLSEVVAVTGGTSLSQAFTNSIDGYFDVTYKGSKDRLGNFRNYGAPPTAPTITTRAITLIADTTANSGGINLSANGASITQKGVCWSTSANPTTADSKTLEGSGTADFVSQLTGLTGSTLYHVRAYATNSVGTGYGADSTFTTTAPGCTRPTGLNHYNYANAIMRNGNTESFSGSFSAACQALYDHVTDGNSLVGSIFESADKNVGTAVYKSWTQTDCETLPDGFYLFEHDSLNDYIYQISNGVIIDKQQCPQ